MLYWGWLIVLHPFLLLFHVSYPLPNTIVNFLFPVLILLAMGLFVAGAFLSLQSRAYCIKNEQSRKDQIVFLILAILNSISVLFVFQLFTLIYTNLWVWIGNP